MAEYSSIFLCHSSADKQFARKLARDLAMYGVNVWIDDAEIKIGDSLLDKISNAIKKIDYLGVILSPDSVSSKWVKKELNVALNQEINSGKLKVLPLLYKKCNIPFFLKEKHYANFLERDSYQFSLENLLKRLAKEDHPKYDSILIKEDKKFRVVFEKPPNSNYTYYIKTNDPSEHLRTSIEIKNKLKYQYMDHDFYPNGNLHYCRLAEDASIYDSWFEMGDWIYFDEDGRTIRIHAYRGE